MVSSDVVREELRIFRRINSVVRFPSWQYCRVFYNGLSVDSTDRVYFLGFLKESVLKDGLLSVREDRVSSVDVNSVMDLLCAEKVGVGEPECLLVGGGFRPLCACSVGEAEELKGRLEKDYSTLGLVDSVNSLRILPLDSLSKEDRDLVCNELVSPEEVQKVFCIK